MGQNHPATLIQKSVIGQSEHNNVVATQSTSSNKIMTEKIGLED